MERVKQITNKTYTKLFEAAIFHGLVLSSLLPGKVSAQIGSGIDSAQTDDQPSDLFAAGGIFQTVTNILLFLIGAVSVIMLIIGGFKYVISGGDSSKVESAKNTILYAIIGIIVAILAYAAVDFIVGEFSPGRAQETLGT